MKAISLQDAYKALFSEQIQLDIQEVDLYDAHNLVLSEDIYCTRALPPFDNSAMDGYAISSQSKSYSVVGTIFAGDKTDKILKDGQCIKVMTGAMIPHNTTAIIPFEHTTLDSQSNMEILKPFSQKQNIRFKGEEKNIGDLIAKANTRLDFGTLGSIASQGISKIKTYRKLKIGIFSSGNELIEPGHKALEHQIYNTNSISYYSLLKSYNHEPKYMGILPDEKQILREKLEGSLNFDVIITSGGASVGEADFFEEVLVEMGAKIIFKAINIKPGKPTTMARLRDTIIFALPGNPLSGAINLSTLIIPTLEKLSWARDYHPQALVAINSDEFKLKEDRANIVIGNFDGQNFTNGGKYSSGAITTYTKNNALAIFESGIKSIQKGQKVNVIQTGFKFCATMNSFFVNKA